MERCRAVIAAVGCRQHQRIPAHKEQRDVVPLLGGAPDRTARTHPAAFLAGLLVVARDRNGNRNDPLEAVGSIADEIMLRAAEIDLRDLHAHIQIEFREGAFRVAGINAAFRVGILIIRD